MSATMQTEQPKTERAVLPSGLGLVQFAAAAVDGLVLSSITVHALIRLRIDAGTVGLVLATAAAVALVTAPLSGAIADRVGLPRAGAWYATLSAAALVTYAVTDRLRGRGRRVRHRASRFRLHPARDRRRRCPRL